MDGKRRVRGSRIRLERQRVPDRYPVGKHKVEVKPYEKRTEKSIDLTGAGGGDVGGHARSGRGLRLESL